MYHATAPLVLASGTITATALTGTQPFVLSALGIAATLVMLRIRVIDHPRTSRGASR
jgi:hypothetical protein